MAQQHDKKRYLSSSAYVILEYLYKFMFFLIIPVLRQILTCIFDPNRTLNVLSANMVFTFLLIGWAYLEYRSKGFYLEGKTLYFKRGFLVQHKKCMNFEKIHSLTMKNTLATLFCGAVKLSFDTPAGGKKKADVTLTLKKKDAERFFKYFVADKASLENNFVKIYRAKISRILLMTLFWANPASGFIVLVPFVNHLGKLLGEEVKQRLYFDVQLNLKMNNITKTATFLSYILFAGWLCAFFLQLFRYANFEAKWQEKHLLISHGLVNTIKCAISLKNINALILRQTILMRLLGLYSIYISVIGYSKVKDEKNLLVAAMKKQEVKGVLEKFFSDQDICLGKNKQVVLNSIANIKSDNAIYPLKEAYISFLAFPVFINILLFGLVLFSCIVGYSSCALLFALFGLPVALWWLISRFLAYRLSFVSFDQSSVLICNYKKFSLYYALVPIEKIQLLKILQNPFQRKSKRCDLKVFLESERKECFFVKNVDYANVEKLVENVKNAYK